MMKNKTFMLSEGVEVTVVRKKMKHLRLAVLPPEGRLRVSAPFYVSDGEIRAFVLSKADWAYRQIALMQSRPLPPQPEYTAGEIHFLFGRPYRLALSPAPGKSHACLTGDTLLLASAGETAERRAAVLLAWYRDRLREALQPLVSKWEPRLGVKAEEVRIKNMSTRWGTCNPAAKRVWINLQLAKYPLPCLEYIVVHELVHLLEPSHSKRFTALMDHYLPGWRSRKQELRAPLPGI